MLDELIASPGVVETSRISGRYGVMALHGGLEAGTATAAQQLAQAVGASLYTVTQPDDLRWHVPSTRFDPRASRSLEAFLEHITFAISLHGFGRPGLEEAVLVGGSNRRVAASMADALRRAGLHAIDDLDLIPRKLRGLHSANPVNLPPNGGVQLELSVEARRPEVLAEMTAAVAPVLLAETSSLCARR